MSQLYLYDDAIARTFEPFALTRPTCELRAGAFLLRERWERALAMESGGVITASHLQDFDEPWSVHSATGAIPAGSIVANSRFAASVGKAPAGDLWRANGKIAATRVTSDTDVSYLTTGRITLEELAGGNAGTRAVEVQGHWIEHVWDLIGHLNTLLNADIPALIASGAEGRHLKATAGEHPVFVEGDALVEPHVVFDTTDGPVYISRGAKIQAFTRIVGPTFVGRDSILTTDKIAASSIGEVCRVHGELVSAIMLGHANKSHDGFVGHSYLGRWVNLGAGTITSNLKNTYGTVHAWTAQGEVDTGLQFLGTFFGDHAKTGIGTPLSTGSMLGAGANVYGAVMPPKVVAPFAWGERPPYSIYRLDKFIEVARRVMARRHVELSDRQSRMLCSAHERRWSVDAQR